jgi:hypothetical protein
VHTQKHTPKKQVKMKNQFGAPRQDAAAAAAAAEATSNIRRNGVNSSIRNNDRMHGRRDLRMAAFRTSLSSMSSSSSSSSFIQGLFQHHNNTDANNSHQTLHPSVSDILEEALRIVGHLMEEEETTEQTLHPIAGDDDDDDDVNQRIQGPSH